MANVAFTRDEAILALDVLYFADELRLNKESKEIIELSELLNELPIIPLSARGEIFRNSNGIKNQLIKFKSSYPKWKKDSHVGSIFYEIADEFGGRKDELHKIACAIRKNRDFFKAAPFGGKLEGEDFPEGALLYHLHRLLEAKDGWKVLPAQSCEICHLNLAEVYKPVSGGFLQAHLTVPITSLNGNRHYKAEDFIAVCPNCHAMLHKHRPWLTKENAEEILF
jgi:5-methylcytosine-specific restriction enzyme A